MKCTIFHAIGVLGVVAIGGITLYMLNWLRPIKYNDFDTIDQCPQLRYFSNVTT